MIKNRDKGLKLLVVFLIFFLQTPILIKIVVDFFVGYQLTIADNLVKVLALSNISILNYEYLFKITLAFSDFNFKLYTLFETLSLLDVLPFLSIVLLLEVNRISKKNHHLKRALWIILIIYLFKYVGVLIIGALIMFFGLKIMLGINYIGIWLLTISTSFLLSLGYLLYGYLSFLKYKDY
ncbi:MAG: hypothetical protein GX769_01850 [Erysipelothrix sp.]|nr:hypothetical protein [Erysipelothrix sp.]